METLTCPSCGGTQWEIVATSTLHDPDRADLRAACECGYAVDLASDLDPTTIAVAAP